MPLKLNAVIGTLAALLFFLGIAMLAPMAIGLIYGEPGWWAFGVTALFSLAVGAPGWYFLSHGRLTEDLRIRDGFLIVALSWFTLSLVGAVPFVLGGVFDTYTDAFFETMSGFTTTGASVLGGPVNAAIENVPHAFLFWRSLTQWLGGMGIIVLTLAILPILGVGGMQLFKAEMPGPSADKLTPRIRETAKRLWYVYLGITLLQVLLLLPALGLFESVTHAFSTMSTGGFSTRDASVAAFESAYVEWVIVLFMFLGGMNFALHFRLIRGKAITVIRDTEFLVYASVTVIATILVAAGTWGATIAMLPGAGLPSEFEGYAGPIQSLRYAAFQVVSIMTTTGFATGDYELWPPLATGVLFLLFFVGGMAGSTGGGMKVLRHVLLFKNSFKEIKQLVHPQAVMPIRLNGQVVSAEVMRNVLSFAVLYFGLIALGTGLMALLGLDLLSAFGAAVTCIGNIGPAFGSLGPTENYAHLNASAKWVLSFLMMAGRLEIFTVLILFVPTFWRK